MIADHPIARELFGTSEYLNPETIHWGEGCVARLEGELSRVGAKRVFLITTGSIARNPALLAPIETAIGGRLVGKTADIAHHAPVRAPAPAPRPARVATAAAPAP